MKQKRSLSGIYFRFKNPETGKIENRCFEDLPVEDQKKMMEGRGEEWIKSLALRLAETVSEVADLTGITKEVDGEEDD